MKPTIKRRIDNPAIHLSSRSPDTLVLTLIDWGENYRRRETTLKLSHYGVLALERELQLYHKDRLQHMQRNVLATRSLIRG